MPTTDRLVDFVFCPDFKSRGPRIVLLAAERWRRTARQVVGVDRQPFFTRCATSCEPSAHADGHPWAWSYTNAEDLLKDEARIAGPEQIEHLRSALMQDMSLAATATSSELQRP